MSDFTFPYPSATAGATVTAGPGNSGHTGVSTTPPTFTQRDGYWFIEFGLAAGQDWVYQDFTATDTVSYADVIYVDIGASAALEMWYLRNSGGQVFNILTNTTDLFQARYASTTVLATSTAFTETVPYKRQMAFKRSTGQFILKITPLAGGTALLDYTGTVAGALGSTDLTRVQWGDMTTTPGMTALVGRIHLATGADALDAGALKLIEPYTVVPDPPAGTSVHTPKHENNFASWTNATSVAVASQVGPAMTVNVSGMLVTLTDDPARTDPTTVTFTVTGPGGTTDEERTFLPFGGGTIIRRGGMLIMEDGVII